MSVTPLTLPLTLPLPVRLPLTPTPTLPLRLRLPLPLRLRLRPTLAPLHASHCSSMTRKPYWRLTVPIAWHITHIFTLLSCPSGSFRERSFCAPAPAAEACACRHAQRQAVRGALGGLRRDCSAASAHTAAARCECMPQQRGLRAWLRSAVWGEGAPADLPRPPAPWGRSTSHAGAPPLRRAGPRPSLRPCVAAALPRSSPRRPSTTSKRRPLPGLRWFGYHPHTPAGPYISAYMFIKQTKKTT